MEDVSGTIIGVAWYDPKDWDRILQLAPDRDTMHAHHAEWLVEAKWAEQAARSKGHKVRRVLIDPDQLAGWCAIRGRAPDAAARAEYVSDQLRRKEQQ